MPRLRVIAGSDSRDADGEFENLVREHYETLFRVAYRFTQSRHDAEDLVQDAFVRAYRNLDRVRQLDNPRTWLLCVMRNQFIDQTRRSDWRSADSFDGHAGGGFSSDEPGPMEQTESALMARLIERSWRKLSSAERLLLALHDVEGYSLAELQEITGLKTGTIKSRLHRARVRLGRLLRSQGEIEWTGSSRRTSV